MFWPIFYGKHLILRFLSNARTTLKRTCEIVFLFRPICYPTFFLIWLSKASSSQLRSRSTQWPNLIIPIFSVYLEKEEWITFHRCSTSISNGMYYVSSMMYHDIKWNEWKVSSMIYLEIKVKEWCCIFIELKWNELHSNKL